MSAISHQHLKNIAKYLQVPVGTISKKEHLYTRVKDNQTSTGIINIIFSLLDESQSKLAPTNSLEEALVHQWLEYGVVYVSNASSTQNIHSILKELNGILVTKTYLVDTRLTIADVFLYYLLVNIMESLSILDKEKYLHVCRWFDNVQQDAQVRQKNNVVDFSTNYLANIVPVKH